MSCPRGTTPNAPVRPLTTVENPRHRTEAFPDTAFVAGCHRGPVHKPKNDLHESDRQARNAFFILPAKVPPLVCTRDTSRKDEDERHIPAAQLFSLRFFTTASFFALREPDTGYSPPFPSANRPVSAFRKNRTVRNVPCADAPTKRPDATGPSVFPRQSGPESGPRRYGCRNRRGRCPAPVPHNRPGAPPGTPRHRTSCR